MQANDHGEPHENQVEIGEESQIIHLVEPGEGGVGIKVEAGDQFVIPAGFIRLSLDPAASSGRLYRPGVTWLVERFFFDGRPETPGDVISSLETHIKESEVIIESSSLLKHLDLSDPEQGKEAMEILERNSESKERLAVVVHEAATIAKEAIAENDAQRAAWALDALMRARSMLIFKQHLEDSVWRGYLASHVVYESAAAASKTPAEAEAIKKLEPMFSRLEESVLHTWVKSGMPIGSRIGVSNLSEEVLKALAEWHLIQFQRKREEAKFQQDQRRHRTEAWSKGLTTGMAILTGTITAIGTAAGLLYKFGIIKLVNPGQ